MPTIPEFMTAALAHHGEGRLREAESIYQRILDLNPDFARPSTASETCCAIWETSTRPPPATAALWN